MVLEEPALSGNSLGFVFRNSYPTNGILGIVAERVVILHKDLHIAASGYGEGTTYFGSYSIFVDPDSARSAGVGFQENR